MPPGDELLCDADAHVVTYEIGAAAAIGGISVADLAGGAARTSTPTTVAAHDPAGRLLRRADPGDRGRADPQPGRRRGDPAGDPAGSCGRSPTTPGVALHCDGARIWHAHVADGVPLVEYGALFDTLSVCLSKGLGAPVGSLVVGSAERIARARVIRKRMGGGMRQAGILAAAGRYALRHHLDRLAEDHARARRLAEALAPFGVVDAGRVRTNIVPLDLSGTGLTAAQVASAAREQGLLVSVLGPRAVRLVTHLDLDDAKIDYAVGVLSEILSRR